MQTEAATQIHPVRVESEMGTRDEQSRYWLAAYTRSRHEQQVARQLQQKQMEYFLPSYNKMRRFQIPQGTGRASL